MTRSSSTQRKISRALVGGLGVTLALGGMFWLGQQFGSANGDAQKRAERGEADETTVAAVGSAGASSDAGTGATTRPADPFASQLARANVLETPTAPAAGAPGESSATETAPMLAAAATTRPTGAAGAGELPFAAPQAGADRIGAAGAEMIIGNPINEAMSRLDHGKTLEARRILNTALTSGQLSDADAKTAKQMLSDMNAIIVFSSKQFQGDEFGGTFVVPPGGVLEKIAKSHEITVDLIKRINGITDPRRLQAGRTIKVLKGPFNAVVDKSDFSLELWIGEPGAKGSMYVTTLPVGLGADDSTPTGTWAVQNRLQNPAYFSPRGEGVIAADDPKNPLGEYWIGLTGTEGDAVGQKSYGIHGTIEPETIGKQASMGCIRLRNEDVQKVFEALVDGKSTVTVRD